ncbi:DeoR/GlpR family DNA-binding transcription regulator [Oceanobacillus caeni]|uniref:DeoR/GlpR family DNA-binding transcription regulator n=1 Tax=Oceanobacillus caeni TaxID=405946 RepID=UPI00195E86A8
MFVSKRLQLMFQYIKKKGVISINEIASQFDISVVTARKDIEILEKETTNIKKVHGGVLWIEEEKEEEINQYSNDFLNERFQEQRKLNLEKKKAIAKKAATLLNYNESILLDAGSTIYEFSKNIPDDIKLTVFITTLNIAEVLESNNAITKIVLGGVFRSKTTTMISSILENAITSLHADKLFISASGCSPSYGFTCSDILEGDVKKKLLSSTKAVYWLVDSSKIGNRSSFPISPLNKDHYLIVDDGIKLEDKERLEKQINVIVAEKKEVTL